MMDPEHFDERLRELLRQEPFVPFTVELTDGRRIVIRKPQLAFGGGSAGFLDPDDGGIVGFDCREVSSLCIAR